MTDLSHDSYDSAPPRGPGPTCTRVYLLTGHYAHLQWDDQGGYVMCERGCYDSQGNPLPRHDPDDWLGTGSQDEYDKAARLPLCPRCFARRERRLPDPRLGAGHNQGDDMTSPPPMTNRARTALRLLDYGFALPQFTDAWPDLIERGWVRRLDDDSLHVTGDGRRALRGLGPPLVITVADGESRAARTWPDGSWTCPFCESPTLPGDSRPWSGRSPCANPACIAGGRGSAAEVAEYRAAEALRAERARATAAWQAAETDAHDRAEAERRDRCADAIEAARGGEFCWDCWAKSTGYGKWMARPVKTRHRKPENCPVRRSRRARV